MLNLKKSTIKARLRYGWTKEKALNTPVMKDKKIKNKCKELNISYSTVIGRMNTKCLTLEEALSKPVLKYKWNGKSLHQQFPKIQYQRIRMRLKRGWSLEDAVLKPAIPMKKSN